MHFDPDGFAGFSRLGRMDNAALDAAATDVDQETKNTVINCYRQKYIERRVTWRTQSDDVPIPKRDPGVRRNFLPLQDPLDEVARLSRVSAEMLLDVLQKSDLTGIEFLVKRHPVDRTHLTTTRLERLKGDTRFIETTASIHELFANCDEVLTVNSGVGFEALLAGLPVTITGHCDYHLAARLIRNADDLVPALKSSSGFPGSDRVRDFLFHYFQDYILDPEDSAGIERKLSKLADELVDRCRH